MNPFGHGYFLLLLVHVVLVLGIVPRDLEV